MTRFVIGFFGDGPWAHSALEKFLSDSTIKVAFVCSRFHAPDPVLERLAHQHEIMYLVHPDVNSETFRKMIPSNEYDLFVSMSFDQIFSPSLIEVPRQQAINCHAGKLPFYRGRSVLNWVLINDEREFGVTVHQMDEGIDTGDILAQRVFSISDADDYSTLLSRAQQACPALLVETVDALRRGTVTPLKQSDIDPTGSCFFRRGIGDERLDWGRTAREIFNLVRAVCPPGPAARTRLGDVELCVHRVVEVSGSGDPESRTGTVISVDANGFVVATADSMVRVVDWSGLDDIQPGDRFT